MITNFKLWREINGLTQDDIAASLGVTQSEVSCIERASPHVTPTSRAVLRILDKFGPGWDYARLIAPAEPPDGWPRAAEIEWGEEDNGYADQHTKPEQKETR